MSCFPNLADRCPSARERVTPIAAAELAAAGFQPLSVRLIPAREVMADVVGVLADARGVIAVAYRRWYYWSVEVRRPLPIKQARAFNKRYFDTVRAEGMSGGTNVTRPVTRYHVDTPDGLLALVSELCPVGTRTEAHWEDVGLDADYSGPECCSDPSAP